MKCPTCGGDVEHVVQPPESPLNKDQWDAIRCGDYYCDHCRMYWWIRLDKSFKQSAYSLRPKDDHIDVRRGIIVPSTKEDTSWK